MRLGVSAVSLVRLGGVDFLGLFFLVRRVPEFGTRVAQWGGAGRKKKRKKKSLPSPSVSCLVTSGGEDRALLPRYDRSGPAGRGRVAAHVFHIHDDDDVPSTHPTHAHDLPSPACPDCLPELASILTIHTTAHCFFCVCRQRTHLGAEVRGGEDLAALERVQVVHRDHPLLRLLGHRHELAVGGDGQRGDALGVGRPRDELLSLLLDVVPAAIFNAGGSKKEETQRESGAMRDEFLQA